MNKKEHYNKSNYDVVILGGGITGITISILLVKLGFKVAVIEKTGLNSLKPGESLGPDSKALFNTIEFNTSEEFAIEYFGNISRWGSSEPVENNFIANPYGNGISIDRSLFENKLLDYSSQLGNEVYINTSISSMVRNSQVWELDVESRHERKIINADFLFFAGGRSFRPPFKTVNRTYFDKLIGLSKIVDEQQIAQDNRYLYAESLENGWFYTNMIPGNKRVLTVFADNDLTPQNKLAFFTSELNKTIWFKSHAKEIVSNNGTLRIYDARSAWTHVQCGHGYLTVGDAAYSVDPLSGQGIKKNLEMILFICHNIKPLLSNKGSFMEDYMEFNKSNFNNYWSERKAIYGLEKRWASQFWQRRA